MFQIFAKIDISDVTTLVETGTNLTSDNTLYYPKPLDWRLSDTEIPGLEEKSASLDVANNGNAEATS